MLSSVLLDFFNRGAAASRSTVGPPCSRCQIAAGTPGFPDINSKRKIAVGTPGPQQQASDRSGHARTLTASARSQWALLNSKLQWALPDVNSKFRLQWTRPNLNSKSSQIAVCTPGSQQQEQQAPDRSGHSRTTTHTTHNTTTNIV